MRRQAMPSSMAAGGRPRGESRQKLVIRDMAAVQSLNAWRLLMSHTRVQVDIAGMTPDRAREWQTRMNAALAACGCGEGAVALLGAVTSYALIVTWRGGDGLMWSVPAEVVLVAIAAALCGKALGIIRAGLRIRRLLRSFRLDAP